jgi:hypothetical protein
MLGFSITLDRQVSTLGLHQCSGIRSNTAVKQTINTRPYFSSVLSLSMYVTRVTF